MIPAKENDQCVKCESPHGTSFHCQKCDMFTCIDCFGDDMCKDCEEQYLIKEDEE
jgi:hypothetical protein